MTSTTKRPTDAETIETLRLAALALDVDAETLGSDDIVDDRAVENVRLWAGRLMELSNNIADALESATLSTRED